MTARYKSFLNQSEKDLMERLIHNRDVVNRNITTLRNRAKKRSQRKFNQEGD